MDTKKQEREMWLFAIIFLFGFAALLRLLVGVAYINKMDTFWYRNWAISLPDGFFTVYARAEEISLDYPPLYLISLYLVGQLYRLVGGTGANIYTQMLLLKIFPILFDCLCGVFLYRVCSKKFYQRIGFVSAMAWLFNPSMFFNSTLWGQSDSVMCFFLLLAFWYVAEERPVLGAVLFAVAGLTKYQSLMFTPAFLLELLWQCKFKWKKILTSLGGAAATVAVVFLPFMIGSGNPLLFFDVYLGGAGKYPWCSLYCFNFYGMMGLDWANEVKDTETLFGGFTYQMFGYIMVGAAAVMLILLYVRGRRRSGWVGGLFFMQCIFMFMTRMHERYQIVVLPFALMAWLMTRKRRFGISFAALTVMTALNQFMILLFHIGDWETPWEARFDELILPLMSAINFLLFLYTAWACISYFLKSDKAAPEAEEAPQISAGEETEACSL